MMRVLVLILCYLSLFLAEIEIDPKGYVIYCPCMGRFGNQVDQLLGTISFAKGLERTLVLPPFIDFSKPGKAQMIPFEEVYQPKFLGKFLKVITLADFKREIAPVVWPKEKRKALCWTPRESFYEKDSPPGCHAKEGNPFGPFWDYAGVEFVGDEFYGKIEGGYDLTVRGSRAQWNQQYSPSEFPVLAFTGAPGAFPSKKKDWETQKYLRWNGKILRSARKFINETLVRPFVGIHLRNNVDWKGVCDHIHGDRTDHLFASAQCLGDHPQKGAFSKELCAPSDKTVVDAVVDKVGSIGARSIYVTSDKDFMVTALSDALTAYDVKVFTLKEEDPFIALAILQEADHFIGNCISTFSSIVSRHRQYFYAQPRGTSFFGHTPRVDQYMPSRKIEL